MIFQELTLNIFRFIAVFSTQWLLLLVVGARLDLFFGFNHIDSGVTFLVFLFVLVPVLNMIWLIIEIIMFFKLYRHQDRVVDFLMPIIAIFLFAESLAIDLYIISQARM